MAWRELVSGFSMDQEDKGIVATRVFLNDSVSTNDNSQGTPVETGVYLPDIGDVFDQDSMSILGIDISMMSGQELLICRKRTLSYVGADSSVAQVVCSYSNDPVDTSQYGDNQAVDTDTLPQQLRMTGEFQLFNPNASGTGVEGSHWHWETAEGTKIIEPIPFRVRTYTLTLERVADYTFMDTVKDLIGKVNEGSASGGSSSGGSTLFSGAGCWLFTGCDSEMFTNYGDQQMFRYSMSFQFRDPDGTASDGWQKILNKNGEWKMPYNDAPTVAGQNYIYATGNLDSLFSSPSEGQV